MKPIQVNVSDLTKIREQKKESGYAMLEANTDRSYFMIGAVIVAALLIGIAIWLFNGEGMIATMFQEYIYDLFGEASKAIGGVKYTPPAP